MTKKSFILLSILIMSASFAFAQTTTIEQIQSPIYTDDIGRSHFLGKGGYSSVRQTQMNQVQADFVNDAVNNFSNSKQSIKQTTENIETDITKVIKEKENIPVSSKTRASFTVQDRQMDPSASFGHGATYLPTSGVNESKTIYTDDLGRLHFFGKGNLIRE